MKKKLSSIAKRRQRLVAQAAEQRGILARDMQPLQNGLSIADKSLSVMRYIKNHPILAMGIAAAIGMLRPMRAVKWLRRSWVASLMIRGLRTWLIKS